MIWVLLILVGREPQILPRAQTHASCLTLMREVRHVRPHARIECVPVSLPKGDVP